MRQKVNVPTNGSVMILKAKAEKGSSSEEMRSMAVPPSSDVPLMASTSSGAGM